MALISLLDSLALSSMLLIPIGFLALSLIFYVALVFSVYVFHKTALWAFLGIVGSILLACITVWLR
jgi:hypothetical protein